MCCIRRHTVTKTRSCFLKMFAGNISAGDELGDGITSSMSILYDLDAAEQEPGPESVSSWDWDSNLSTASSNYSTTQQNTSNGSQKMAYQEPWNEGYSSVQQMYFQNGYSPYASQNYDSSYDSSKQVGQMQSSYDNYGSSYSPNYSQQGRNSHWLNTPNSPQPLAKGNSHLYLQHGLQQKSVQQRFEAMSSGSSNYKILPSKKFTMGNLVGRDCSLSGQKSILSNGYPRRSIAGTYQGHKAGLIKNTLGGFEHGLVKIVSDNTSIQNKHTSLVFHDPPYQRQKPMPEQPPPLDYAGNGVGRNDSEKPFSPTAIELVTATTDDDGCSAPPSPQVIVMKTVPIRNTIFGYKKLKYRCMRCGNRDATFNSQLTHVKSHRKPYCMQCCWIGDHALQLKAHVEKAHPKIDTGSGTTMVTSKYGRKCQVNTSVAVGLKRKKISPKSPQKSASNPADAEEEKPEPNENHVDYVIKTDGVVKVEECEDAQEVDPECCSPVPKKGHGKGSNHSEAKEAAKMATPPTRELSKRRLALMAKNTPKEEGMSPPKGKSAFEDEETPPSKGKVAPKGAGTPLSKVKNVLKDEWTPPSKRKIFSKDAGTPPNGPPQSKGKIFHKDVGTPPLKEKIVPKDEKTPPPKRKMSSRDAETVTSKVKIVPKDERTPPSKGKIAPIEVREMLKRGLRKK